jgi:CubicO group peptidase (beta-lactamase class C family)
VRLKSLPSDRVITIRDLLTHTAGRASRTGITAEVYAKMAAERKAEDTVGDMTRRLAKLPLKFHPGTAWEYGASTDVLGHLVEVVSGLTLDQFFQERIFRQLGMFDTHFYLPEEKLARFPALYTPGEKGGLRLTDAPATSSRVRGPRRYFSGGGGLLSTAADYLRFHQMMLNGGQLNGTRLLGRKTVELMTANHIRDIPLWPTLRGYRFGLGYRVRTDVGDSALPGSVGEYGWGGAFCTYFWVDPKEEMIGIFMTQVAPYTHLNIRQEFQMLAYSAIID